MADFKRKRTPAVAGQFYPANPDRLRELLAHYLTPTAAGELPGDCRALIVPHAGYTFSGATAGGAYAAVPRKSAVKRVVVLAPAHYAGFHGLSVGDYQTLVTPLGDITVDTAACRDLLQAHALISNRADIQAPEHALEVQLPFIQSAFPQATVVPLVCGDLAGPELRELGRALAPLLWQPDTFWVVSSDFTHYGEDFGYVPFTAEVPKRLEELDKGAIDFISHYDLDGFLDYLDRTGATICGRAPIALLLAVLATVADKLENRLLAYTTSGKMTHDWKHTVSYAALAFFAPAPAAGKAEPEGFRLNEAEQALLLKMAREAIRAKLEQRDMPPPEEQELPPVLREKGAAFVTLSLEDNLRGCIGHLKATEPLYRNVIRNARYAAFEDSRFFPVTATEFPRLGFEISVLTAPRPITSLDEFILGRHGIIFERGRYSSVFLPQVPLEEGWDKETTLNYLALKAGLEQNAWRRNATFSVFEAFVFNDHSQPAQ